MNLFTLIKFQLFGKRPHFDYNFYYYYYTPVLRLLCVMTLPCFSKRGIFVSEFKLISQIQYVRREMMEISLRAGFTLSRTPATSYSTASTSSNDTNCNIKPGTI